MKRHRDSQDGRHRVYEAACVFLAAAVPIKLPMTSIRTVTNSYAKDSPLHQEQLEEHVTHIREAMKGYDSAGADMKMAIFGQLSALATKPSMPRAGE